MMSIWKCIHCLLQIHGMSKPVKCPCGGTDLIEVNVNGEPI